MIGETPEEYRERQAQYGRMLKARMVRPEQEVRRRQRERSLLTGLLLGGFVLLVFAISVAKIKLNW